MAYARLATRNASGLHPNFRGLGAYANLSTRSSAGLNPNFRGLGDVPPTTFSIGPGGQWSVSSAAVPTPTSLWDQVLTWLGQSSVIAGVPNSLLAIGGGLLIFSKLKGGRH
jgi:hypothetical protein